MSSESSEKFLTVLTKMSENQNSLENKIDTLTQKFNSPQQIHQTLTMTTNNKLGKEISEAEPTKIEDVQIIKDTIITESIRTIEIKDEITIKTT